MRACGSRRKQKLDGVRLAASRWSAEASAEGCDRRHSSTSASSTPSARASARTESTSAFTPFVHPAYAIFSADAAAGSRPSHSARSSSVRSISAITSPPAPDR